MGRLVFDEISESNDPNLAKTREVLEAMDKDSSLDCLKELPAHLATFVRSHVMHDRFNKHPDLAGSVDRALEGARKTGLPTLIEEAESFVESRSRVGNSLGCRNTDVDHVYFDCPIRSGKVILSNMVLKGHNWKVIDFGDSIPEELGVPIGDLYGKSLTERNKCLIIHLAAAGCCTLGDTDGVIEGKFSRVMSLAREIRVEQFEQAKECGLELGEPTPNDPLIVAELRSHVHDVMNPHHDRDHKTLLCFPVKLMEKRNICLIRVTPSCLFSAHVTKARSESKEWSFLVSFQGHMRLTFPPSYLIGMAVSGSPRTLSQPTGWRNLMQFESSKCVGIDVKALGKCPNCQANSIRLPLGVEGTLVGKSMIADEAHLRSFSIEKPWTRAAAEEVGPDAVRAWGMEEISPPPGFPAGINFNSPTGTGTSDGRHSHTWLTVRHEVAEKDSWADGCPGGNHR